MDNQKDVNIELIKGTLDDYIVKDKDKIVIGRFTITELDKENKKIILQLKIDTKICPVIKYFEIFLERMLMSKRAAHYLNIWFGLEINGATLL